MSLLFSLFPEISAISAPFSCILLDAYGVFWGGNSFGLLPGAKEGMENLVRKGKRVGILSNSTQLAFKERDKFQTHGLLEGKHFHFLMTSGEIAKSIFSQEALPFKTPRKTFWLFGGVHPKFASHAPLFQGSPYQETPHLEEADFIYISIPHLNGEDQTDPHLFQDALQELYKKKLPMVCPNPDLVAHEGNPPRAVIRQGSIAAFYEKLGGTVFYIGKPYPAAYAAAMKEMCEYKSSPSEVLMVGDTPETDIRGARSFGMASALTMRTGNMGDRVLHHGLEKAVEALLPSDIPNFFIERL